MNCVVCGVKVGYACAKCSKFPYIMAIHPPVTTNHGESCRHNCLTTHRRAPTKHDRRVVKGKRTAKTEEEE